MPDYILITNCITGGYNLEFYDSREDMQEAANNAQHQGAWHIPVRRVEVEYQPAEPKPVGRDNFGASASWPGHYDPKAR